MPCSCRSGGASCRASSCRWWTCRPSPTRSPSTRASRDRPVISRERVELAQWLAELLPLAPVRRRRADAAARLRAQAPDLLRVAARRRRDASHQLPPRQRTVLAHLIAAGRAEAKDRESNAPDHERRRRTSRRRCRSSRSAASCGAPTAWRAPRPRQDGALCRADCTVLEGRDAALTSSTRAARPGSRRRCVCCSTGPRRCRPRSCACAPARRCRCLRPLAEAGPDRGARRGRRARPAGRPQLRASRAIAADAGADRAPSRPSMRR